MCTGRPKAPIRAKFQPPCSRASGVDYVIIGHSEQRSYFNETDETVNKKVKATLAAGLLPIICVGETLDERKKGLLHAVIERQVKGAYIGISEADALKTTIAYEPVWAIGTGEVATPDQANEAHIFIRSVVTGIYGQAVADAVRIQYGGSMKPDNARDLLALSDVDGGLGNRTRLSSLGSSRSTDELIPPGPPVIVSG